MGQAFLMALLVSGMCQEQDSAGGEHEGAGGWIGEHCHAPARLVHGSSSVPAGLVPSSVSCCRPSQPLLDRSIPDFTAFTSVDDWLSAVKMSQYRDSFLTAGFTSLQLVAQMTSE